MAEQLFGAIDTIISVAVIDVAIPISVAVIDVAIPIAITLMAVGGAGIMGYFIYRNLKEDEPPATAQ